VARYKFRICPDNLLFFLEDGDFEAADFDIEVLSEGLPKRRLAVLPGMIAVGTTSQMTVPVQIQVSHDRPKEDLSKWDAVVESGIVTPSGVLFLKGSGDAFGERIEVASGCYGARVYYGGQGTSDLEGNDYYKIVLWPLFQYSVRVLKRWKAARHYRGRKGHA
jgi:hypothetical protein